MVILITAYASAETALAAMKEGAFDYLEKDFKIEELTKIIRNALAAKGAKQDDLLFLKEVGEQVGFGGMIGKSSEMLKIYAIIRKIAQTPTNVLILGESGTGKELVARAIHENSSRSGMPFVIINCGGIPENLLESEFFGYCKGAFTGAYQDKQGLFEFAKGGTIFLDEIAELPPLLQVKLLRVVQEKTFRRIGGADDIIVDVRIISATNKNLADMVKAEKFREDLYYRLNVIPLFLPPLRERKEDIPVLTNHFIDKYSRELKKDVKTISAYAMQLLLEYPFPGNIRELKNIIERSVALETSNIILPDNLMLSEQTGNTKDVIAATDDLEGGRSLNDELALFEKNMIEKAIGKANGSKTKAAEMLGITYDSLHYRCEKLGIFH
jgi:two-component system response regulator PilR (NtrC family)